LHFPAEFNKTGPRSKAQGARYKGKDDSFTIGIGDQILRGLKASMEKRESHFLEKFLYPESVAVVVASRNPLRPNHNLVANLAKLGFQGKVYPVNPETDEIAGLKSYPDLKSIPGPIDLAVIAVP
jgi:hypothetical protein